MLSGIKRFPGCTGIKKYTRQYRDKGAKSVVWDKDVFQSVRTGINMFSW